MVGGNFNEEPMQPLIDAEKTFMALTAPKCKRILTLCHSTRLTLIIMVKII